MHKLGALYLNEMIKIWRKLSVIIIVCITVAGIGITGVLMRFTVSQNMTVSGSYPSVTQKSDLESKLSGYNDQIKELKTKEANASADTLASLKVQEQQLQGQADLTQYQLDQKIYGTTAGFRETAAQQLFGYRQQAAAFGAVPEALLTAKEAAQKKQDLSFADRLNSAVEHNDFGAYISVANDIVNATDSYTADEKKMYVDLNNLKRRLGLTGQGSQAGDGSSQLFGQIQAGRLALLTNIDQSGGTAQAMTDEQRRQTSDNIAVYTWELQNKTYKNLGSMNETAAREMISIGTLMAVILMMILAGSAMSQEMSTGSIKSLIIAPVRRWKIFTAKFLSLLTMCVGMGLLIYLVTILTHGLLFGFGSGLPYVYAINGVAHTIPYYPYLLCYLFVSFLEVFVYLVLALMLSTLTRNTAASVGVSIAVYFGGSIITSMLLILPNGLWQRFIPFGNFSVTTRVFPYDSLMQSSSVASSASNILGRIGSVPLSFSLGYTAVVLALMFYAALDSFCRRDIR